MEKNVPEKQTDILNAAVKLFSERGFEPTTVDEIAAQAGVGKGTIYLYFENKEQIFRAVIEQGLRSIDKLFTAIIDSKESYLARIKALIQTQLQFVLDNQDFYRIFLKERINLPYDFTVDDESSHSLLEIHRQLNRKMNDFFSAAISDSFLRANEPELYTIALSGIVSHVAFHWLMHGSKGPLVEKTPAILEQFLHGAAQKSN
jgi:TetR/AcrR family fatty acid metabolism transcriptional regulator